MTGRVLLIGSGGREHVIAWKLSQSKLVESVFVIPGNAGTEAHSDGKVSNVSMNLKDFTDISNWCHDNSVDLVIVGPEDPLAAGLSDHLQQQGISCFGPKSTAAEIESSKEFAKEFMMRHGIPTARFQSFTDAEEACKHINSAHYEALVVKASGLAAGKGVVVADTQREACDAVKNIIQDRIFGDAGCTVVVEELLEGDEISVLAFTDGHTVCMMPPAQDFKRLKDGDRGPNTGGMGALCPYPKITQTECESIKQNILQKTIDGLRLENRKYVGVLYAGLMITEEGIKVLEFNCRFGDPETQSILPLLTSDLYTVCRSCVEGTLQQHMPEFDKHHSVVGIVVASGGYPQTYKKGCHITGLDEVLKHDMMVFHAGTTIKDDKLLTNGGRVLTVVAMDTNLATAAKRARTGASLVKFDKAFYRNDIALKVSSTYPKGLTYTVAGVNIDVGRDLVTAIKPLADATRRPGCMSSVGMFGALFDLHALAYKDPILVSGTDGVGTKLKIAQQTNMHHTIGIDLVAMCVNDVLAHGAEPLFFLDYFATGRLSLDVTKSVISGIADGCKLAKCALIGGETAEMPGMYVGGEYDLAGFSVGVVERQQLLPRLLDIKLGDVVIGLQSSGLHSNGFSMVRKVIETLNLHYDMPSPLKTSQTLGEDLLVPTKIYTASVLPLMKEGLVKAFAHITGGGLTENIPRILPGGLGVHLDANSWMMPSIFGWLAQKGRINEDEMAKTFNCGIGAVLIVNKADSQLVIDRLRQCREHASAIGTVENKGGQRVQIENLQTCLMQAWTNKPGVMRKKRVGVLISGSGTNLQALLDYTKNPENHSAADVVLVISNKPGVAGLQRAVIAGVQTKVITHSDYKEREKFDAALHTALTEAGVEIVCLAGFMRILTGGFVRKWNGRMLNIHPSLLPSFKGIDAHSQVLKARVLISGCTVHFVSEAVDSGAIVVQESVPVFPGDTEDSLAKRVRMVEHKAFPKALELIASEKVTLNPDGQLLWTI
ncbi:trifunctional purine biosynthetic protein adenosine-3-like [Gigantopelta aegis]|uniref:trifunctional purine biosynthetic protein adenosine-3-like n=1 Tax=Gigantopelta aegis TaxID=1735272 RepID=UPI001B88D6FD|nr:trifunctional purine biosynthetic protein adenosine-3-like [Gigantopelta aegis]